MKLASGFCIPEPLPVHTGLKGRQVRLLIRFLLRSQVDEKSADLHKAFHLCFVAGRLVSRSGALPLYLSSRRCMRSWRSRGWALSQPEAARPPPPSSLPSPVGRPGGTRAFPRWRARSRCTCAHGTPPLGGTVRISRPRPVSWQPLSRPKLVVLWARQPPPCTPWLSCRFTKPRRSNRCTRVVPTRGWCRSCARRLTSL